MQPFYYKKDTNILSLLLYFYIAMVEENRGSPNPGNEHSPVYLSRRDFLTRWLPMAGLSALELYRRLNSDNPSSTSILMSEPDSTPNSQQQYRRKPIPAMLKGVNLPSWRKYEYYDPDTERSLLGIYNINGNSVAFTPSWGQQNIWETNLKPTDETPDNNALRHIIRKAHDVGLLVALVPHAVINVESPQNGWHGRIGENFSDTQWREWFRNYNRMIFEYAELAEETQVELFGVGSELYTSTERRVSDWVAVIEGVKKRYHGPTTYAAYKRQELASFPLWRMLTYAGANLYDDIATNQYPSLTELRGGMKAIADSIRPVLQKIGKQLIIPELGYYSAKGAGKDPWRYASVDDPNNYPLDLDQQANCARALLETIEAEKDWIGLYWWHKYTNPNKSGPHDRGYSYEGKPAEKVLAEFYKRHL